MAIHSILPPELTQVVETVLREAGSTHVAHGDRDPVAAAEAVVADREARAVIGPFRSRAVAEVVEVTASAGLPLLAPVATWAGVTRSDEPGCEDPARHRGTVLRLVARDTVVAQRIAQRVRDEGSRALVVAGDHEYGAQLDGQLELGGLPRAASAADADLVVLAGLNGEPEGGDARALAPLPIVAFDGIQGEAFPGQRVELALVYAPGPLGVEETRRAAELVCRTTDLEELRRLGRFDEHGDPIDPLVRFERYDA
ncbi:MAG TPA: hypothetical protein VGF10_13250 [Gaiella sp.]|jgi:hypothetical protein